MRVVVALAAAALAAVGLSACGSSRPAAAHVSAPPRAKVHWPGAVLFIRGAPSHGLGVDNTDLLVATPNGSVRDLTSSPGAESNAAWSADGSRVVFERDSTTGHENGDVAYENGIYTWSPGHGSPQRIASCPAGGCAQSEFAWSPNDRQIAFLFDNTNDTAIRVMNADGSGVHTVCDDKRCGYDLAAPLWSPDGRKLVFSDEGVAPFRQGATGGPPTYTPISNVWTANADGSSVKQLTQPGCKAGDRPSGGCSIDTAPTWSPNGKLIAFRRDSHLEVMHADGSHVRSIAQCVACDLDPRLVWTPDSKAIAYPASESIRITTLAGTTKTTRTCAGIHCVFPEQLTWSPSGEQLAFLAGGGPAARVWVIGRDGEAMHWIAAGADNCCLAWAQQVSLRDAEAIPKLPAARHLKLSGTIAYEDSSGVAFLSLGASGGPKLQQTSIDGLDPTLSPDGREIAYGGLSSPISVANIYVADRNGGNVRVLTHTQMGATSPTWSPDGRTIAFNGSSAFGIVSAAGGRARSIAAQAGISQSWNPSGSELLFERQVGFGTTFRTALFTVHPDGSGLRRLTNLPGSQDWAAWSPDGKEIAFDWRGLSGTGAFYLIHPDGTHLRRLTTAQVPVEGSPTWSPNSRYLAVFAYSNGTRDSRVDVIDVKTGRFATVAIVPGYADDGEPSWSAH